MTQNRDSNVDQEIDFTDPPEGLEITELIAKQRFRIRKMVPFSGRVVGALTSAYEIKPSLDEMRRS